MIITLTIMNVDIMNSVVYRTAKINSVKGLGFKENIRYNEGGMPIGIYFV